MEKIVSLTKRRGFVFPGSDIYGGLANTWDYGPLGIELKNNIKKLWWKTFVHNRHDVVGIDTAILMNPEIWNASGHLNSFNDPLMDCRDCKSRYRADKLIEEYLQKHQQTEIIEGLSNEALKQKIIDYQIACPLCGGKNFTDIRQFNLMFKTFQGVTEDSSSIVYLRPETAQGIFINFKNVQNAIRKKIPFGIAQVGKSFRNEITPGNFIFRTREFEQMELEYFCHPDNSLEKFTEWKEFCTEWLHKIGISSELIRIRDHEQDELSHYSQATTDIEFKFPFGWGELWGIAHRGDYDLSQHQSYSKKDLTYQDPITNQKFIPQVIEPSLGVDRLLLAILVSAYTEEALPNGETRTLLRFHPQLAPTQVAILPLSKQLNEPAEAIFQQLSSSFNCDYDVTQSIGKRYRRQDEIGTPYCVTIDFDTLEDQHVTVRNRDTMEQQRVPQNHLVEYLEKQFKNIR